MAKIDTSKIEGYEAMTPEQKLAALEAYEINTDYSGYVKKDVFDKTASELASTKKQLREKMSAAEREEKDNIEKMEQLQSAYDGLLKQVAISDNKSNYLSLGYDDHLASETAEALANGDLKKVFENQQKYMAAFEKKIRANVLKETPRPENDTVHASIDFQKKIVEAQQGGDFSAAAYYTRLAAQENSTEK